MKRDRAPGIDGVSPEDYRRDRQQRLPDLLSRVQRGLYVPNDTRPVDLFQAGKHRRLEIPTVEDAVLQKAVLKILTPTFEQVFLDCSFGYRPGLSVHDAIQMSREEVRRHRRPFVLDADLEDCFGTIDHRLAVKLLALHVADPALLRLIRRWLDQRADGRGVGQGSVIGPLVSNVVLHYVLDTWAVAQPFVMVRWADDLVIIAPQKAAQGIHGKVRRRLEDHGLVLHPTKTRAVPFGPGTGLAFDFLGFAFSWSTSRRKPKRLLIETSDRSFEQGLTKIAEWLTRHRDDPVVEQYHGLRRRVRGHVDHFGIVGNERKTQRFVRLATDRWQQAARTAGTKIPEALVDDICTLGDEPW